MTDCVSALSQLADLLPALAQGRVLVVGDVMLDRYVRGSVDRISPEAPIPVMRVDGEDEMLGGAGNVARNIAGLGAHVTLVGLIGDDAAGRQVIELLGNEQGIEPLCVTSAEVATTVKTRYLASNQQLLRADMESKVPPTPDDYAQIAAHVGSALANAGVVVMSDYAKGLLSDRLIGEIMSLASSSGIPVVVDPKSSDLGRYRGASLLTPNRDELSKATGMLVQDDDGAVEAASAALTDAGVAAVLVTRGPDGMTLVVQGKDASHFRTRAQEVFDVSGAGDTVVATIAAVLAAGRDLDEAASLANVAAGIVVGKIGTAVVHPDEIAAGLHAGALLRAEEKVVSLAVALERAAQWRRHNRRVVFTNGCFDLIHPGHISLLEQARASGDALIVGLNSDASVYRLKGEGRPVQPAVARASVLAGLSTVDLVVEFSEDTPMELIQALKPDVLVKGADYSEDEVVGGELVRSYGGRVVLADLAAGHSTTDTIARANRGLGGNG